MLKVEFLEWQRWANEVKKSKCEKCTDTKKWLEASRIYGTMSIISQSSHWKKKKFYWLHPLTLSIRQLPIPQCGVGAHQRKGKRQVGKKSEKSEEKEKDRGTEGKTPNPILGNWCAHTGWKADGKQKRSKWKKQEAGPQPSYPRPFSHLLRCALIIQWVYFFYSAILKSEKFVFKFNNLK